MSAVSHARGGVSLDEVKDSSVYVSTRSLRVLRGIALDRKKQVLIILAFFVFAWTVSISSLRGRGHDYNRLKVVKVTSEIEGVEEACSTREEVSFDTIESLEKLLCFGRMACGVDHDVSLAGCDEYWRKTLQRGHIESIELPKKGRLDKDLRTIDEIVDFLEDQLNADTRMKIPTQMSMGYHSHMLPLPWNSKTVIQRQGYYTPDGRFINYRVQGVGGGNTYAFYCDRILGFNRVLPSSMRLMTSSALERLLVQSLRTKARSLRSASEHRQAMDAIRRRAKDLAAHAAKEFSFNKTHVLVEMISAIPDAVERESVHVNSKSPLLKVSSLAE